MKSGCLFFVFVVLSALQSLAWAAGEENFPGLYFSSDGHHYAVRPELLPAWPATMQDLQSSNDAATQPSDKITAPQTLNFDTLPAAPWTTSNCDSSGSATVSQGIMTLNSPSCYEFMMSDGPWNQYVSNKRGWVIQASLAIDPSTQPECSGRGAVEIWANDHTNLVIVGFSPNEVCIAYPETVTAPVAMTDCFHTYRIEGQGANLKIYVDGNLVIDHTFSVRGQGSDILDFGDGDGSNFSLSYWNYLSYDVFPRLKPNIPNPPADQ